MADSHANLLAAMKAHAIRKIVTMSAFGATDSYASLNILMQLMIKKSNMLYTFEDHDLVDREVKESGMDFVLARPAMLTDKEAQPVRTHGNCGQGSAFMPSIYRKSVAVFLLDAAEKNEWDGSTPVISNQTAEYIAACRDILDLSMGRVILVLHGLVSAKSGPAACSG